MRIVADGKAFQAALEGARREAKAAFGDDRVLIERYLERPRHIEMQVFGDAHGNVVHLYERDCSVQRRHQKVIEEAPAPRFLARAEMGAAAVAAAKAIRYTGAGTVEFIAEQDGRFYFMEMNTRLQVEHPVTEMITGLDLVELQLRVAARERLPFTQDAVSARGHAIEARIYAEDPERDFLPATGKLLHLAFPVDARVDTGVRQGDEISAWYDPLIAKLIVHGEDRASALARLAAALRETQIVGLTTNVEFLRRVCESAAFANAELETGLIERHRAELFARRGAVPAGALAAAALAELAHEEAIARRHAASSGDAHSPWYAVDGWRLNAESHHDFTFTVGEAEHRVRVAFCEDGRALAIDGRPYEADATNARTVREGRKWHVFHEGVRWTLSLKEELAEIDVDASTGSLAAPMPGRVIKLFVEQGAHVKKGDPLLILEAMKMEHTITAPSDGTIKEIHYAAGEQVLEGAQLIRME